MLVRSGVKHDLRPHRSEDLVNPAGVADVRDDQLIVVEQRLPFELHLQAVQVRLVVIQQVQRRRTETLYLPAQLAADGTSRARDEDPLARHHRLRRRADHAQLVTAKQA